jgi:hypothetical protein
MELSDILMNPHCLFQPACLWFLNVALTVFLGYSSRLGDDQEPQMSDALFMLSTVLFFALGILYLKGCERLK